MNNVKALARTFDNADRHFFAQHPDRQAHIRLPYLDECRGEFWALGEHNRTRRRIILWRVPRDNPYYDPSAPQLMKLPMLLFSDESVEDTDEVLLAIIHEIMEQKAGACDALE
jgi:hypothetical protein